MIRYYSVIKKVGLLSEHIFQKVASLHILTSKVFIGSILLLDIIIAALFFVFALGCE